MEYIYYYKISPLPFQRPMFNMECDQNTELILQLLEEDLKDLEGQQKGKQAAGNLTDLELTIAITKDEILAAQASIQDKILAISTGTAIATDQNVLMSIKNDERVADQDHRYAIALNSDGRDGPHLSSQGKSISEDNDDNNAISTVMADLMNRASLSENLSKEEGPSPYASSSKAKALECAACLEHYDTSTLFISLCGHGYCHDCNRQLFIGAIKDEELYPPRCCGRIVPPGIALRLLNYHELQDFCERAIEHSTKDCVYCAEPTCSKFIPPFSIENEHGTCPQCRQATHLPCRSLAHPGVDCPMDDKLQSVLAMADEENWRRCSSCRAMIELHHGCNHITCR